MKPHPILAALALLAACAKQAPPPPPVVEAPPAPEPVVEPPAPRVPLHPFFEALARVEDAPPDAEGPATVVLHLGASHTASDTLTGRLRDRLQGRFGDAGRGLVPPGEPWRWYRQESCRYDQDGDWRAPRASWRDPEGPLGLTGVRLTTDDEGATLTAGTCERCDFGATAHEIAWHLRTRPDGGAVRVTWDDGPPETISTRHTMEVSPLRRVSQPGEDAPRSSMLEVVGDGPVDVLGVELLRHVPGVRYVNLGVNGTRADQWLRWDPVLLGLQLALVDPDLVVLHWGINEMYAERYWPPEDRRDDPDAWAEAAAEQTRTYVAVLDALRADRPERACLLLLPTDLAPDDHPLWPDNEAPCEATDDPAAPEEDACHRPVPPSFAPIVAAQRRAAEEAGCAVWDEQAVMGGPGSHNAWRWRDLARPDGIHLTLDGYRLLSEALFADLMQAYARWRDEPSSGTLASTPVDLPEIPDAQ